MFLFPALLCAQLSWNTVTVTASQNTEVRPDQAVFAVVVEAGLDQRLDEIVRALEGTGIGVSDLDHVNAVQPNPPAAAQNIQWSFRLPVPLSKVKETAAALSALQQKIAASDSGISLASFGPQGPAISSQAQQSPNCNLPALIADARAQAQKLAGAAGFSAGAITGISGFSGSCSITVRFALGAMFAQSEPDSVTVAASRSNPLQSDQVALPINVEAGMNSGLDDILAALQGAGITGANFSSVYGFPSGTGLGTRVQSAQWFFNLRVPLAKAQETLMSLASAQQALAKSDSPLILRIGSGFSQISPELRGAQSCSQTDLLADAREQAQKLAAAAGASAGAILSMSDGVAGGISSPAQLLRVSSQSFAVSGFIAIQPPPPPCALTVQYQLLRR